MYIVQSLPQLSLIPKLSSCPGLPARGGRNIKNSRGVPCCFFVLRLLFFPKPRKHLFQHTVHPVFGMHSNPGQSQPGHDKLRTYLPP